MIKDIGLKGTSYDAYNGAVDDDVDDSSYNGNDDDYDGSCLC